VSAVRGGIVVTHLPRLVVAGTRSGVGKTSITCGLLAALTTAGHRVSAHKVGPDFIDPGYHAVATGRPPRNLDRVLHGLDRLAPLLAHGAAGADLAVIEGVMGLFDGRDAGDEGSTAEVARHLGAPVMLVVDASASSRSIAAEVHGFATFDRRLTLAGVVLDRVGSDGHERLLRDALTPVGVPVVGAVREEPQLGLPERHLGLVPAAERRPEAERAVARLGAVVGAGVDLEAVVRLARAAPPLPGRPWDPHTELAGAAGPDGGGVAEVVAPARRPRIAVAGGAAFSFSTTEHLELLAAAGAEVVTVDPLHDAGLPDHTDGLLLGGGFPEVHAPALADNRPLVAAVRALAAAGRPVVAECGGLLYLCREVDGTAMVGVLDAVGRSGELTIGYRTGVLASDTVLGPAGTRVQGQEFHVTTVTPRAGHPPAWRLRDAGRELADGFAVGRVHASYLHASWVGVPTVPRSLVAHAADAADGAGGADGAG
jgi:cobyrinic acid a,c-diamide synthase